MGEPSDVGHDGDVVQPALEHGRDDVGVREDQEVPDDVNRPLHGVSERAGWRLIGRGRGRESARGRGSGERERKREGERGRESERKKEREKEREQERERARVR